MHVNLKPLAEQTIVITGATSGIGLTTARMASERGANVVLAARSDDALRQLVTEITSRGRHAVHVDADVGNEEEVRSIATTARKEFGGFDTWVNNAGVSIYGKLTDVSIEDMRRLFETNFWGVVYGSRIATEELRTRGGALINVGSAVSDRAMPLQGIYSASKHAVKGFTDALRMELEKEKAPVSVTLIKPAAINTPYTEHAKNYFEDQPRNPPPVYAPEIVADAILHCAVHPERELFVGSAAKVFSAADAYAPEATDKAMEAVLFDQQHSGRPKSGHEGLWEASGSLRQEGDYEGHTQRISVYTKATMYPMWTLAALGAGLSLAALWRTRARV